jgi:hypothetical protein
MSFFAKKIFGAGKKESPQGYTPPPMPPVASDEAPANPEELWLSDNAGSPIARGPPASGSTPGGGLGLGEQSGGRGSMVTSRLEQDSRTEQRVREQREREQLEEAIRISQEMAQQEEATRAAAAFSAAAAAGASSRQPPSAPTTPGGLFSGLSLGGSAATSQVLHTGLYGQPTASSAFSFVHDGSGNGTDAPVEAAQASAFSFMQSSGVDTTAESSAPQRVGHEGLQFKQTIEPIEVASEPLSQVYLNIYVYICMVYMYCMYVLDYLCIQVF